MPMRPVQSCEDFNQNPVYVHNVDFFYIVLF